MEADPASNPVGLTLLIAGLLALIAAIHPLAEKLRLPQTVLLAAVGGFLGFLAAFQPDAPLTEPFRTLSVPSSVFLYVFLPLLLFQASMMLEARRALEDAVPILVMAVVAVLATAGVVGFSLEWLFGLPLVATLLLGAIVATTDPAAVVTVFRDVGAPARLRRLVEGESLLNDAAAIALFSLLLSMVGSAAPLDVPEGLRRLATSFAGGLVAGYAAGQAVNFAARFLRGQKAAEVTLTIAAVYLIYVVGDLYLDISGVVAVVIAGLAVGAGMPASIAPKNWRHMRSVWEQVAHWASSLIFLLATILVPRFLMKATLGDFALILFAVVGALLARAFVLFVVLPLLEAARLSQHVSPAFRAAILWGGLRGAVTLALALAITENDALPSDLKEFIGLAATGFVLFGLLVNGLSLKWVIRWLKLDRLSSVELAVRDQVLTLALSDVSDRVRHAAQKYELEPTVLRDVSDAYAARAKEVSAHDIEQVLSDRERLALGLIALAAREKQLILEHHGHSTITPDIVRPMLRHAERLIEAARAEGRTGYNRSARRPLEFGSWFRAAYFLHRWLGLDYFLRRQLAARLERLLVLSLLLPELQRYVPQRIAPLLGPRIGGILTEIVDARSAAVRKALEVLRLQYPSYADALERGFLIRIGEQQELRHYDELFAEGLLGQEVHESLRRALLQRRKNVPSNAELDVRLDPEAMIRSLPLFVGLSDQQVKELAQQTQGQFVLPGDIVVRKGETRRLSLFFIASGVAEVRRLDQSVILRSGDFFGEIALLTGQPRSFDVVALTFCHLLTLGADAFRCFLEQHPELRQQIEETANRRIEQNLTFEEQSGC